MYLNLQGVLFKTQVNWTRIASHKLNWKHVDPCVMLCPNLFLDTRVNVTLFARPFLTPVAQIMFRLSDRSHQSITMASVT